MGRYSKGFKRIYTRKAIVSSGLILHLSGKDFKNSPATETWNSKVGTGNSATVNNFAYTATSGSDNSGGVVFDGTDDFVVTPHLGITGNQPFTLMVRGKLIANAAGDDVLFAYTFPTTPSSKTFGLYTRYSSSKFRVTTWSVNDYDTGFSKDTNEHVWALVYDGTGTLLYQDNVVDPVGKKTTTNPSFTSDCVFIAGKLQDTNYSNFKIKGVAMYNRALTLKEIIQNKAVI